MVELDDKLIKDYVGRFEELLSESNVSLMCDFLKAFIAKVE